MGKDRPEEKDKKKKSKDLIVDAVTEVVEDEDVVMSQAEPKVLSVSSLQSRALRGQRSKNPKKRERRSISPSRIYRLLPILSPPRSSTRSFTKQ
jgi:hypothetical protein